MKRIAENGIRKQQLRSTINRIKKLFERVGLLKTWKDSSEFRHISFIAIFIVITVLLAGHVSDFYEGEWVEGVITEAHGMIADALVLGVLVVYMNARAEKRKKDDLEKKGIELEIKRYNEEIEDFLGWDEKEATYRIIGIISRLNKMGEAPKNLENAFLKKANLNSINLCRANLSKANLSRSHLHGANLREAILIGANLNRADLKKAKLEGANLKRADLRFADLRGATINNETKIDQKWENIHRLVNKEFIEEKNNLTNLSEECNTISEESLAIVRSHLSYEDGSIVPEIDLSESDLRSTDFTDEKLIWACFHKSNLSKSSFRRADLKEADLSEANMTEAVLEKSDLSNASLERAILRGADLRGACLEEADLSGADLSFTHLQETIFWNTNLAGVDFTGADFTNARIDSFFFDYEEEISVFKTSVKNAIFKGNHGLTEDQLLKLEIEGAIVEEEDISF